MLVYDMQTMQVLFYPPDDEKSREVWVMSIAETLGILGEEQRRRRPNWTRYNSRHREKHLARQKHSRATHRDQVRTYNQQYEQSMTMRRGASRGAAGIAGEVASCST